MRLISYLLAPMCTVLKFDVLLNMDKSVLGRIRESL